MGVLREWEFHGDGGSSGGRVLRVRHVIQILRRQDQLYLFSSFRIMSTNNVFPADFSGTGAQQGGGTTSSSLSAATSGGIGPDKILAANKPTMVRTSSKVNNLASYSYNETSQLNCTNLVHRTPRSPSLEILKYQSRKYNVSSFQENMRKVPLETLSNAPSSSADGGSLSPPTKGLAMSTPADERKHPETNLTWSGLVKGGKTLPNGNPKGTDNDLKKDKTLDVSKADEQSSGFNGFSSTDSSDYIRDRTFMQGLQKLEEKVDNLEINNYKVIDQSISDLFTGPVGGNTNEFKTVQSKKKEKRDNQKLRKSEEKAKAKAAAEAEAVAELLEQAKQKQEAKNARRDARKAAEKQGAAWIAAGKRGLDSNAAKQSSSSSPILQAAKEAAGNQPSDSSSAWRAAKEVAGKQDAVINPASVQLTGSADGAGSSGAGQQPSNAAKQPPKRKMEEEEPGEFKVAKLNFSKAVKSGLMVEIRCSNPNREMDQVDLDYIEDQLGDIFSNDEEAKKRFSVETDVIDQGLSQGVVWWLCRIVEVQHFIINHVKSFPPPEGRTEYEGYTCFGPGERPYRYILLNGVKRTLWKEEKVLLNRIRTYNGSLNFQTKGLDGELRLTHIRVSTGGKNKEKEINEKGNFQIRLEIDEALLPQIIKNGSRVKVGFGSWMSVTGGGIEKMRREMESAIKASREPEVVVINEDDHME